MSIQDPEEAGDRVRLVVEDVEDCRKPTMTVSPRSLYAVLACTAISGFSMNALDIILLLFLQQQGLADENSNGWVLVADE